MGINAIVLVQNTKGVAISEFIDHLKGDHWGRLGIAQVGDEPAWAEFEWQGEHYFTWLTTPRDRYLCLYGFDEHGATLPDSDSPRPDKPIQLSFLKLMLAVERFAGGPIFVGNDAVSYRSPHAAMAMTDEFYLPTPLDHLIKHWREVADIPVDEPLMVF